MVPFSFSREYNNHEQLLDYSSQWLDVINIVIFFNLFKEKFRSNAETTLYTLQQFNIF